MTYGAFLTTHPLFWATLCGTSVGVALATALRNVRGYRRPSKARSRKWTAAALWMTAGVAAATAGILVPAAGIRVPGATGFLSMPSLYTGAGALVFVTLALRFPRAGGIPAFLVIAVVAIAGPLVMRPFVPVRDSGVAATSRLLAISDSTAYVETVDLSPDSDSTPVVVLLPDSTVAATATYLEVSDYLFFLGAHAGVRFNSLLSLVTVENDANSSPDSGASAESPYNDIPLIGRIVDLVPLLTREEVTSPLVQLRILQEYETVALADGSLVLRAVATPE